MTKEKEKVTGIIKKVGLGILFVFLLVSLIRNISIMATGDKRIAEEEAKLEKARKKNSELKATVAKISTPEYLEKQARDRLGLVREGETIVVLPDEETLKKMAPRFEREVDTLPDPTWKKWVKLFL